MNSKTYVLDTMRRTGRERAQALREKAPELTSTEIISQEDYIPDWLPGADYTPAPAGTPVRDAGQVYGLLQPHNAAHYPDVRPADLPALWRVKHTTDPAKAKPWVKPASTSDLFLVGDVCLWTDGQVYRAARDTDFSPEDYPPDWEVVSTDKPDA